jgi:hypothetical protein
VSRSYASEYVSSAVFQWRVWILPMTKSTLRCIIRCAVVSSFFWGVMCRCIMVDFLLAIVFFPSFFSLSYRESVHLYPLFFRFVNFSVYIYIKEHNKSHDCTTFADNGKEPYHRTCFSSRRCGTYIKLVDVRINSYKLKTGERQGL